MNEGNLVRKKQQTATSIDDGGTSVSNVSPLKKAFVEAYRMNMGNATKASEAIGINRRTFSRWYKADSDFAALVDEIKEEQIDLAESELRKLVKSGNITAVIFTLKTIGKERGYIERTETETYNMTPVDFAEQAIENERTKRASN
ncbi:MAG: hypothetical protein II661_00565 [Bacteroidales bacterium]|nr:hypothetical protein [Bacteroidales bacterium]